MRVLLEGDFFAVPRGYGYCFVFGYLVGFHGHANRFLLVGFQEKEIVFGIEARAFRFDGYGVRRNFGDILNGDIAVGISAFRFFGNGYEREGCFFRLLQFGF